MRTLALLIGPTLALWLVLALPAHLLWGEEAVVYSGVAALLCLVPMTLTNLWCQWALRAEPEQQLLAVLGGTGLRLLVVIGVAIALFLSVPYFYRRSFMLWVIFYYLVTLGLEVGLLVARQAPAGRSQDR
jgi:hypothetical protein